MCFAMPQLKETRRRDRPLSTRRRAIVTHPLRIQIIPPLQRAVERNFNRFPALIVTQGTQDTPSRSSQVQGTDHMTSVSAQGLAPLLGPRLNMVHPMVSFGKDMGQPDHSNPPQADPLAVTMHWKVLVQQGLDAHLLLVRQQQGDVISPFTDYGESLDHAESLPQFAKLVRKMGDREY